MDLWSGMDEMDRWRTGELQSSETILYDIVKVDTGHYIICHIVETIELYSTKRTLMLTRDFGW